MSPKARVPRRSAKNQSENEDDEDEIDEDEDDAGEDIEQPERPQELTDLLASFGNGAGLSAKVWRASLRPEDLSVPGVGEGYAGFIPKGKVKSETLEDEIIKLAGGGVFKLDFYIDSAFAKGASRQLSINGPAIPKGLTAPQTPVAAASTAVDLERERAKWRAELEAENAKKKEMADLLAAAVAPLAAKLQALELRPVVAPAPSIAERFFEKKVLDDDGRPKQDPAMKALMDKIEKMEERDIARDRAAAKAEKENMQAQIDALRKSLADGPAKPATAQSQAAAMFAPIAEALAVSTLMNKAERIAEDNDDDSLSDLMKEFKAPLFKQLKAMARGVMKGAAESLAKSQQPQSVPTSEIPADFTEWARFFLGDPKAIARASDVEWVRASLQLHRPQITRACAITDKAGLAAFAGELFGPIAANEVAGLTGKKESDALLLVSTLRESVRKAESTPPPPVQATVEPETEDDEDEESEDEEDDDGEDD